MDYGDIEGAMLPQCICSWFVFLWLIMGKCVMRWCGSSSGSQWHSHMARLPIPLGSPDTLGKFPHGTESWGIKKKLIQIDGTWRHFSEVINSFIVDLYKIAKATSNAVVCSGPISMWCGDAAYSRLWSLKC